MFGNNFHSNSFAVAAIFLALSPQSWDFLPWHCLRQEWSVLRLLQPSQPRHWSKLSSPSDLMFFCTYKRDCSLVCWFTRSFYEAYVCTGGNWVGRDDIGRDYITWVGDYMGRGLYEWCTAWAGGYMRTGLHWCRTTCARTALTRSMPGNSASTEQSVGYMSKTKEAIRPCQKRHWAFPLHYCCCGQVCHLAYMVRLDRNETNNFLVFFFTFLFLFSPHMNSSCPSPTTCWRPWHSLRYRGCCRTGSSHWWWPGHPCGSLQKLPSPLEKKVVWSQVWTEW